jgi:hypothetical protein
MARTQPTTMVAAGKSRISRRGHRRAGFKPAPTRSSFDGTLPLDPHPVGAGFKPAPTRSSFDGTLPLDPHPVGAGLKPALRSETME